MSLPVTIDLEPLLDWITYTVSDHYHGLVPFRSWEVSAEGLLDKLVELTGFSKEEMGKHFDEARVRVHGAEKVKEVDGE